jgi:hypothetical protein
MESVDFVNVVKIRGIVDEITEVFRGEKFTIHEVVLIVGRGKYDKHAIVKINDEQKNTKGLAVGAVVQIVAECTAGKGKSGKLWGSVTAKKVEVVIEAKPVEPQPTFDIYSIDDDEIPF